MYGTAESRTDFHRYGDQFALPESPPLGRFRAKTERLQSAARAAACTEKEEEEEERSLLKGNHFALDDIWLPFAHW